MEKFFDDYKGKNILAVFPHPDDAIFVCGGFLQHLKNHNIKVKLICLCGRSDEREIVKASEILGINEFEFYGFNKDFLPESSGLWLSKIKKEIETRKPFAVLTYDPNGITGHRDHIATSIGILNLLKKIKDRPLLLWRVADREEKEYFKKEGLLDLKIKPTFYYNLKLSESLKKLTAIFSFKEKMKNPIFKMKIIEWYLFDHKEPYYKVDYDKDKFNFSFKNI